MFTDPYLLIIAVSASHPPFFGDIHTVHTDMKGWDWETETSILLCYRLMLHVNCYLHERVSWRAILVLDQLTYLGVYIHLRIILRWGPNTILHTWYLHVVIKLGDLVNYSCYQISDHTTIYHDWDHSKMESSSSHMDFVPENPQPSDHQGNIEADVR